VGGKARRRGNEGKREGKKQGPREEDEMLSYRRETALQGALVLAKSGRLELEDNILRTL